jgi:hypothetical protein
MKNPIHFIKKQPLAVRLVAGVTVIALLAAAVFILSSDENKERAQARSTQHSSSQVSATENSRAVDSPSTTSPTGVSPSTTRPRQGNSQPSRTDAPARGSLSSRSPAAPATPADTTGPDLSSAAWSHDYLYTTLYVGDVERGCPFAGVSDGPVLATFNVRATDESGIASSYAYMDSAYGVGREVLMTEEGPNYFTIRVSIYRGSTAIRNSITMNFVATDFLGNSSSVSRTISVLECEGLT